MREVRGWKGMENWRLQRETGEERNEGKRRKYTGSVEEVKKRTKT